MSRLSKPCEQRDNTITYFNTLKQLIKPLIEGGDGHNVVADDSEHIVVRLHGNSKDGVIIDVRVSTALDFRNSSSIKGGQPREIANQDDNPDFIDEEQGRPAKRLKSTAMTETCLRFPWMAGHREGGCHLSVNIYP